MLQPKVHIHFLVSGWHCWCPLSWHRCPRLQQLTTASGSATARTVWSLLQTSSRRRATTPGYQVRAWGSVTGHQTWRCQCCNSRLSDFPLMPPDLLFPILTRLTCLDPSAASHRMLPASPNCSVVLDCALIAPYTLYNGPATHLPTPQRACHHMLLYRTCLGAESRDL